jgi:glucose-1-phosphate thymidylyltransferase
MLAGIREVLIITNSGQKKLFQNILGNGSSLGIKINYEEQKKPNGLPEAFIIGEKFINNDDVALILGDNFFYGQGFTNRIKDCINNNDGATIFTYIVNNPSDYGIAELNKNNEIIKITEKPKKSNSKFAITGLYLFDNQVVKLSKKLKPSKRNELEIVDLIGKYLQQKRLKAEFIGRGGTWLDTGSIEDFYNATNFVSAVENRQGLKIACLEEIALKKGWINKKNIHDSIKFYGKYEYSKYLFNLL